MFVKQLFLFGAYLIEHNDPFPIVVPWILEVEHPVIRRFEIVGLGDPKVTVNRAAEKFKVRVSISKFRAA
jgi:hypothetical protein